MYIHTENFNEKTFSYYMYTPGIINYTFHTPETNKTWNTKGFFFIFVHLILYLMVYIHTRTQIFYNGSRL